MRVFLYIFFLLALSGCSGGLETTDITFYDSYGKDYKIKSASETIKEEYNLNKKPKLILIATSSKNQTQYNRQMNIIHDTDPEKMQYLYIVANSEEVDTSGYYIEKTAANDILSGKNFRITLYNESGIPVKESNAVLNKDDLVKFLTENPSGH